ncbi:MAG TPA: penicillin-binding transpeptidase domain-containing protein [Gaiellaceae bacterium]|nr:penicillin-binding transpeptidase domain-containing protein [Gaiellaceae bacterium]
MNRQISRVALLALVLLSALVVATTYWQTWASGGLAARQDNEIQRVAQFEIKRGVIYASDGHTVLATNVRRKRAGQTLYFRVYPTHGFASQTVGYSTQSRSRAGIEREENSYLTASNKTLGTIFDTLGDRLRGATITGNNLVLTLRVGVQKLAQSLLAGKCGAAVALNPKTGAVYAMASSPTYDPNLIEKPRGYAQIQQTRAPCTPAAPLLNRATQGLYPPGSTFKTVTAAAALDDGVFTPQSTFYDPGYCTEYGKQVKNALDQSGGAEAFGHVNFVDAYVHSINAVFCMIGQKIGAGRVLDQAKKFGFYSTPPLETPSDARSPSALYNHGRPFDPKDPAAQVDPGRLAFGQERMLVTPLQMALVAAAIANNGKVPVPRLVKEVRSPGGGVIAKLHPRTWKQATKPETAAAIKDMMVGVVQRGTGTAAQIPGVIVAGKTGTAELSANSRNYDAWFIFFAPAENPVVAGAVVVENQPNGFGGAIAAPIAKQIMQAILPQASNSKSGTNGH